MRGRIATPLFTLELVLFLGLLPRLRDVTILRARTLTVTGDRALAVQADGEIVGRLPVTIEIADQPVLLIQPEA